MRKNATRKKKKNEKVAYERIADRPILFRWDSGEVRRGLDLQVTGDDMLRVVKWRAGAVRWVKQELASPVSLKVNDN